MSSKYKVGEDAIAHFVTFSVVGWIDVFSLICVLLLTYHNNILQFFTTFYTYP